jgi:hypothetical protein
MNTRALASAALVLGGAAVAHADTFVVNSTADGG